MSVRAGKAAGKKRKLQGGRRHVGWDDELWERRYTELKEYRDEHGHVRVPVDWRGNVQLGRWLAYQRQQGRRGLIEPDRGKRLLKLGVEWEIISEPHVEEHDLYMEKMLARLAAYRERHGHTRVRREEDRALHYWIGRQRIYRNAGKLRKYRRELLDAAGFPWEAVDRSWEAHFVELAEFKERLGHTRVPRQWAENEKLGRWVEHQRLRGRRREISADQRRRLRTLGFQFRLGETRVEEHDRKLDEMLARLRAYKRRYGHAGVLRSRDFQLWQWIGSQRRYRASDVLRDYRRKRMDAAGFPWKPVAWHWEEQFARLRKFKARFGHTRVPSKSKADPKLGSWVSYQRGLNRAGTISAEHRRRLDEIGFQWTV
ncbi:MAG: helicase associated domain-containing protein [Chthoniobacteraceae bacterium]